MVDTMDPSSYGLAGVRSEFFAEGDGLPLFLIAETLELQTDRDAAVAWFTENRKILDEITTDVGALVLRDFAFDSGETFSRLAETYQSIDRGYTGGMAPRSQIVGRAFESTRAPKELEIGLHQEMAYSPTFPQRLAFYCAKPADKGGETTIADMRKIVDRIPAFVEKVREKGVLYTRRFRGQDQSFGDEFVDTMYRTWNDAFGTDDPAVVDQLCAEMGSETTWSEDGRSLTTTYRSPGFTTHPRTGEYLFFNQLWAATIRPETVGEKLADQVAGVLGGLDQAWTVTSYGDGTPFAEEDIATVYPVLEELSVRFPWQLHDVMLVDNFYTAHGRNSFEGERETQVALLDEWQFA